MSEALSAKEISGGVVHDLPADLKKALSSDVKALETWEDITPLARNEWIPWIELAKKAETRIHRSVGAENMPARLGSYGCQLPSWPCSPPQCGGSWPSSSHSLR